VAVNYLDVKLLDVIRLSLDVKIYGIERRAPHMITDPRTHSLLAAERAELLRAAYAKKTTIRVPRVALGLPAWVHTPSAARPRSSRA
jgi:hypothetical protein